MYSGYANKVLNRGSTEYRNSFSDISDIGSGIEKKKLKIHV